MSKVHHLKSWPEHFHNVKIGRKDFEIRENDREFQRGDLVVLEEFKPYNARGPMPEHPGGTYTGRCEIKRIKHIQSLDGDTNRVILGLEETGETLGGAIARTQREGACTGAPGGLNEVDPKPGESFRDAIDRTAREVDRHTRAGFTDYIRTGAPVYKPNGTPLTDHERELLVILMEEAGEVVQAASKLIRFGKENRPGLMPDPAISNSEYLGLEIGDFKHMMHVVCACGLVDEKHIVAGEKRKGERLARYLQNRKSSFKSLPDYDAALDDLREGQR